MTHGLRALIRASASVKVTLHPGARGRVGVSWWTCLTVGSTTFEWNLHYRSTLEAESTPLPANPASWTDDLWRLWTGAGDVRPCRDPLHNPLYTFAHGPLVSNGSATDSTVDVNLVGAGC